ncbi:MAG: glutamate--cysteine ligase [Proteobacteria bacterium]|nr:glutamate--cysteine ligase [Pseudomonadota bacterium]
MTLTRDDPELAQTLTRREQMVDYIRAGETPREQWRVGTEHEKLGLSLDTLEPVPYSGPRGIRALLEVLHRDYGFDPLLEEGNLIGLERQGTSITLEPGGQLELAGAPLVTLHETCREFNDHIALLKRVSEPLGIVWLGIGLHPLVSTADAPRIPRQRYTIMREYLGERDELGLDMMHRTAGVQASFDFSDETDLALKLRVALAASPLQTALWANSSVSGGKPNGFASRRAYVWRRTDPDRCGLLPFAFEAGFGADTAYRRYVEWALDVPMFFILREGRHVPMRGRTFRDYFERGFEDWRPTLADWSLHLTTLFPEVRVKRLIEVRGADAVPPRLVCALPAFWKGIFYDEQSLGAAFERLRGWDHAAVDRLHLDVSRAGLSAAAPDDSALGVARELIDLSAAGLRRQRAMNASGQDEAIFLEPLYEIVERGTAPCHDLIENIDGEDSHRLVEYARY